MRIHPSLPLLFLLLGPAGRLAHADEPLVVATGGHRDLEVLSYMPGEYAVRTTGPRPCLLLQTRSAAPAPIRESILAFDYASANGAGQTRAWRMGPDGTVGRGPSRYLGRSDTWAKPAIELAPTRVPTEYFCLALGDHAGCLLQIRALRLRPPTARERRLKAASSRRAGLDRAHARRLAAYVAARRPSRVDRVSGYGSILRIEGRLGREKDACLLAEVPLWMDATDLRTPASLTPIRADASGAFRLTVPRRIGARDRLLCGWAVVRRRARGYDLLSALRYADARAASDAPRPRSIKGLDHFTLGIPDSEPMELGMGSVAVRVGLNELFFGMPAPGRDRFRYAGHSWYVDRDALGRLDAEVRSASGTGGEQRMVSAVLLLGPAADGPEGAWARAASDPDADPASPGVMPDMASQRGVEAYAAAVDFLAGRYGPALGHYGRVRRWILCDRVNGGRYRTDSVDTSILTRAEHCMKTLRLVDRLTRGYDAGARTLLSLDHNWTAAPEPGSVGARYLLEGMLTLGRIEGDLPWGIALDPVPVDPFEPRVWEERQSTYRFNTPYITYHNLEVLDAWARRPPACFNGTSPREIQLLGGGIHAKDGGTKGFADQAAAVAYALVKADALRTVHALQYARWQDGGYWLLTGLRFPDGFPAFPMGPRAVWYTYRAFGTAEWGSGSADARARVGLHAWAEAVYRGSID